MYIYHDFMEKKILTINNKKNTSRTGSANKSINFYTCIYHDLKKSY